MTYRKFIEGQGRNGRAKWPRSAQRTSFAVTSVNLAIAELIKQ